ncbi:hypothetical protein ASPWEDRAFT_46594 [Aspergillus wentii DTO 134E9]|uniref:Rhodopsin domain-containing protein n=1 Tax=Aspergillus wentii DTO 134E9 TaxID=1073089 RepID=A0A1L9R4M5_ASPWE|nr:uncharacterized protein ASPWEDRAFT_46594 [Aspergillus wentii DTO 134E9]OJJ29833.1 hypothetical protein ASPWEDRAFT_46594 [Aspergillus wentii DTO 134E9]
MSQFSKELAIESWTLYVIGIFTIAARMISRRIARSSWKKLEADDYIMMVVTITFTGVIVCVNETATYGSNYLPAGEAEQLDKKGREDAVWGSKMTFALEHFTLASLWMIKGCLLLIYNRLTKGLTEHTIVKIVAVYVVASYILVEILFCAVWCGPPITMYWDVPVVQSQCATYYNHLITTTVFNISSDIIMLCIPLRILIRSRLPMKRKLVLCAIFSLGVFVILMAILNRYYNFTLQYQPVFLKWYVAEVSTAVYIGNIPLLWPLLRQIFNFNSFAGSGYTKGASGPTAQYHHQLRSRDRFRSQPNRASSMESIVRCAADDETGKISQTQTTSESGFELHPVAMDRHGVNHTTVTAGKDGSGAGTERDEEMGIVRTVQVVQYRE